MKALFAVRASKDVTRYIKNKKDKNLLISADKTTNFYCMDANSYKQLMNTAVTTESYKKAPTDAAGKIVPAEKQIAKNLNLDNRIDALTVKSAFITLKDHKPNFTNNPTCRLINPSKSEIGIVSKKILQRVNAKIVSATHLSQWKNTDSVLTWLNKIPNKPSYSFITFYIIDFYPSISEDLLVEALTFATKFDEIKRRSKSYHHSSKEFLTLRRERSVV